MKRLKMTFCGMGTRARRVLLLGLPIIVVSLLFTASALVCAKGSALCSLIHTFPDMLECIVFSAVLLFIGAIISDVCERSS